MANRALLSSSRSQLPDADAINEAGGVACSLPPKLAMAQLAATGCYQGNFYAHAETQLAAVRALCEEIDDPVYLAKLAIYSREQALMKDMPAALLLILSTQDVNLFRRIFPRVIDNGRMLRTFVQILRSGLMGRRSLSSSLQRAVQQWLNNASVENLLSASIGHHPSLRDVLRLARPTPNNNERRALYGWLAGTEIAKWQPAGPDDLPLAVQALMAYRRAGSEEEQIEILSRHRFRWDLLADAALGPKVWVAIARQMGPQAIRMNLNTLMRHGVFNHCSMVEHVAARITDPEEVRRSKQFPYQFLAASLNAEADLPLKIRHALNEAAEVACGNVPELPGPVVIGVDTSGSMSCPVTGYRGRGTSSMRCVDVAGLFAAAILRRNPKSLVVPFDVRAYDLDIDPNAPVLRMAETLAAYGGGGTNCSLPLTHATTRYRNRAFVGCVLISDSESWVGRGRYGSTAVLTAWEQFARNQKKLNAVHDPRLICINIQAYSTTQAPDREDILNIGGFSDAVFRTLAQFLEGNVSRFVSEVERIDLEH